MSTHPETLPDLVPARMLNEFSYCPRLAYLEWVEGEFAHNAQTLDGLYQHRRVDAPGGELKTAEEFSPEADLAAGGFRYRARAVTLSSAAQGMTAVLDVVESDGSEVFPVDTKRGTVPDTPENSWEPERVQICVQGLILRDNGYHCRSGFIYYAASRQRIEVPLSEELISRTLTLLEEFRRIAAAGQIPPPLKDSPKCNGCSLVGICLPDETRYLQDGLPVLVSEPAEEPRIRQLITPHDETRPLYVQETRAYVGKKLDQLQVRSQDQILAEMRLVEVSQINLLGNVQISTQLVSELCDRQIPICYFSASGYFHGITTGLPGKNIALRQAQFRRADDEPFCLAIARALIGGKIENQRTLLRRNHESPPETVLAELAESSQRAREASCLEVLLGIEGNAARAYFSTFNGLLRPRDPANQPIFQWDGRNRRPPTDPINALLSWGYAILAKELTVSCLSVGLDPFLGFYHQPRYGRPALALDLMEEFRALIVDSTVLTLINTGMVDSRDFRKIGPAVAMEPKAKKAYLGAYERRLESLVTHPLFGYRVSYRRILEIQVRLLARVLSGELGSYVPFVTR